KLFLSGCILRWITPESARYLLGEQEGPRLIDLCRGTVNVKETPRGYVVHDRIRDYCNRYLRRTEARYFSELSEKAAAYYCGDSGQHPHSFEDRKEAVFHLLRAESAGALARLKEEFDVNALLNRSAECEALIEVAVQAGFANDDWIKLFRASVLRQQERYM